METMLACRLHGPGDLRLERVPLPALGPGEVLCRVVRSGLCGTDYAIYSGEFSFVRSGAIKFPMTPGHEWSGVVARVGPGVRRWVPGDRVVGDTAVACGACSDCLLGNYYQCAQARSVGTVNTWDGSHAEYIVMPERHLFSLPAGVSFDQGAMVEPAATALHALNRAEVRLGDTVLVQGSGPIGIMAARLAKLAGAARVIITGRREAKLQAALALGADAAINTGRDSLPSPHPHPLPGGEGVPEAVARCAPQGVDRVIEASGSAELLKQSLQVVRPGGVVAAVAFYEQAVDGVDIDRLVLGSITLRGVAGSLGTYPAVLRLMEAGRLDFTPLITGRYPLAEVARAMQDMQEHRATRIKLMLELPQ